MLGEHAPNGRSRRPDPGDKQPLTVQWHRLRLKEHPPTAGDDRPTTMCCSAFPWSVYSKAGMDFRTRLLRTLRAVAPVLHEPGVLVAGSEVPNLLEPDARSSLVVSQDVDIAIPVHRHAAVKARLHEVRGLTRSYEEPSVWLPTDTDLIEVNFIGMDSLGEHAGETYVVEDDELPLLVFGQLSLLRPGKTLIIDDLRIPLPRPSGLILEKLLTDRSGEKGDRDLLVALALVLVCEAKDLTEIEVMYEALPPEHRYAARSALSTLSLLEARPSMPDPAPHRAGIARLLARLEKRDQTRE